MFQTDYDFDGMNLRTIQSRLHIDAKPGTWDHQRPSTVYDRGKAMEKFAWMEKTGEIPNLRPRAAGILSGDVRRFSEWEFRQVDKIIQARIAAYRAIREQESKAIRVHDLG